MTEGGKPPSSTSPEFGGVAEVSGGDQHPLPHDTDDMVPIAAGEFRMGSDRREGYPRDGEGPSRPVVLSGFEIDRCAVSNARFARFVSATGYVTDAERTGSSMVFAGLLPDDFEPTRGVAAAPWWREVPGADWRHPEGPHSTLDSRDALPVVHVSWSDAAAFAAWAGKRLPTEAQWERAARGGLEGARFPWGDDETPGGEHRCNVWQGSFPDRNDCADGFYGLAPVDAFAPNGFGLHNMVGNCWQWCADAFDPMMLRRASAEVPRTDPRVEPGRPEFGVVRALRGGSYLCHPSYCFRYRVAARNGASPDSSAGHIGFRCVR
jgi:formylglycine-generating enzyme required for sulfatase activity